MPTARTGTQQRPCQYQLQGTALRANFLQPPALHKHVCVYQEAAVPSCQNEQQLTQQLRYALTALCLTLVWTTCDCLQIDGNVVDFLTAASNTFKKVDQRTYMLATNDLMSFNYITLPAGRPCGRLSNALRTQQTAATHAAVCAAPVGCCQSKLPRHQPVACT